MSNILPLHKTVHWRRLKEIIQLLAKLEQIDLKKFDLDHITCYRSLGIDLCGKNVQFKTKGNNAIWVSNNHYDVFEIPSKR